MSDTKEVVEAYQKVGTQNARAAIEHGRVTRKILTERMDQLEAMLRTQQGTINALQQKYNLLLTNRFNGGSTVE